MNRCGNLGFIAQIGRMGVLHEMVLSDYLNDIREPSFAFTTLVLRLQNNLDHIDPCDFGHDYTNPLLCSQFFAATLIASYLCINFSPEIGDEHEAVS